MIYVLTPSEMRAADEAAGEAIGRPTLMRNAGSAIARRLHAIAPQGGRVVAFAGPGDNGGDAFAAVAALRSGYERVVYAAAAPRPSAARSESESAAKEAGVLVRPLPQTDDEAQRAVQGAAVAIDALFGTGARLPVAQPFEAAALALDARLLHVLAVDVPSGIDASSGVVGNVAVRATETVTLAALKPGLLLMPAREHVGVLSCASIGIDDATLEAHARTYCALDDDAFVALLPVRELESDKRRAGAPLVVAGSRQFPGAAILCALGAARAGAGYVTLATPSAAADGARAHLVEQVVVELADGAAPSEIVETVLDIAKHNSAIAIGPGLALDDRTGEIVRGIIERATLPIVADASALFHLGKHLEPLRGKQIVLTPHAGEFARLSGKGTVREEERVERLREFVDRTGIATLLKGLTTLVYGGDAMFLNTTGTNALATAGTGDVLTGVIATLLSQGLSPFQAARTGAYWHGLAGREAAQARPRGVIARDVIESLAASLTRCRDRLSCVPHDPAEDRCIVAVDLNGFVR
ncbi:MAG: NAD(P)H-hydrate dehydratase [Candidatus Tyrphobacter sp.]